jgi:hypothetical protein
MDVLPRARFTVVRAPVRNNKCRVRQFFFVFIYYNNYIYRITFRHFKEANGVA